MIVDLFTNPVFYLVWFILATFAGLTFGAVAAGR